MLIYLLINMEINKLNMEINKPMTNTRSVRDFEEVAKWIEQKAKPRPRIEIITWNNEWRYKHAQVAQMRHTALENARNLANVG